MDTLRRSNGSWRVDETYVRVKGRWMYLYRAVDSRGATIDFLLSATRDAAAAKRFFRKALGQPHTANPRTVTVDKNPAYPCAVTQDERGRRALALLAATAGQVPKQHRGAGPPAPEAPGQARARLRRLPTARRTLAGYEVMAMVRKGQFRGIGGRDMRVQAAFIAELFQAAA